MSTEAYPCDRGLPNGPRGLHHFQAGALGVICCIYCGAKPGPRTLRHFPPISLRGRS